MLSNHMREADPIQETDASQMPRVIWMYNKVSSLSAAADEWTNEIDLLARYWADTSSQSIRIPPQQEIYHHIEVVQHSSWIFCNHRARKDDLMYARIFH